MTAWHHERLVDPAEFTAEAHLEPRAKRGRKRYLTPEQVEQARARYKLWRDNLPKRIAADCGISMNTLNNYLRGKHKPW